METSSRRWLAIFAVAALSFTMAACAGVPSERASETSSETGGEAAGGAARAEAPESGSEAVGEHAEAEGEHAAPAAGGEETRRESAGEHGGSEGQREGGGSEGGGEHGGSEGSGEHGGSESEGEHGGSEGEGAHDSGEEGEESGVYIARSEAWDATRRGARLVLSFNPETNAFEGTVENTTAQTLCAVRVEVHLSSGTELGPTERTDLPSGETTQVSLSTAGEDFETWTAHPELSRCSGGQ